MSKEQTMDQLRNIIREVIREEIQTHTLTDKEGNPIGMVKTGTSPTGQKVTVGRFGPKAVKKYIDKDSMPGDEGEPGDPRKFGEDDMEESYTLEEWMGMMEEAGYSLEEVNLSRMVGARDARLNRAADAGKEADKIEKTPGFKVRDRLIQQADAAREKARFNRDRAERTNQHIKSKVNTGDTNEGNPVTKQLRKDWDKKNAEKFYPPKRPVDVDTPDPRLAGDEDDARRTWVGRLNNPHK